MVVTQQELWPRVVQEVNNADYEKKIQKNLQILYEAANFMQLFKQIENETWPEDRAGKDAKGKR